MPKIKYTNEDKYQIVAEYIKTGNYTQTAENLNIPGHSSVQRIVKEFKAKHPDEYLKIQDIFLMDQKQNLLMTNTRTTQKALNKVDELLDDPEASRSVKDVAIAYGILYEKQALMRGESTSNQAVVVKLSGDLEKLAK